jgi:hypothetical protein
MGEAEPENYIAVVRLVFQAGIRKHKMRFHSGMLGREERQNRTEMATAEIGRRSNLEQSASSTSSRGNLGLSVADLVENGTASLVE